MLESGTYLNLCRKPGSVPFCSHLSFPVGLHPHEAENAPVIGPGLRLWNFPKNTASGSGPSASGSGPFSNDTPKDTRCGMHNMLKTLQLVGEGSRVSSLN